MNRTGPVHSSQKRLVWKRPRLPLAPDLSVWCGCYSRASWFCETQRGIYRLSRVSSAYNWRHKNGSTPPGNIPTRQLSSSVNTRTDVKSINEAFADSFGYDRTDAVGTELRALLAPPGADAEVIRADWWEQTGQSEPEVRRATGKRRNARCRDESDPRWKGTERHSTFLNESAANNC